MLSENTQDNGPFHVEISEDRLLVRVHIAAEASVPISEIAEELRALNIANVDLSELTTALAARAPGNALSNIVARGTPAVDESYPAFHPGIPISNDAAAVFTRVESGQVLATLKKAVPGKMGSDIFGKPIAWKQIDSSVAVGKNVALTDGTVTATAIGNLRMDERSIWVEPVLELDSEHSGDQSHVNFTGDIAVLGCLVDRWRIRAAGSIIVAGAVEAAMINAKGSIHIKGGISGKGQGKCISEQSVWSRFLSKACVVASGDVTVDSEITDSRVVCIGRLTATGGPVVGGKIIANSGVHCRSIGNTGRTPTLIEAGTNQALQIVNALQKIEIEASLKRVEEIREKVGPLMQTLKSLSSEQRERVTEMLYNADELEAQTLDKSSRMEEQSRKIRERACDEIVVSDAISAGVTLRLSQLETVIHEELRGPLRIATRKNGGVSEIVLYRKPDDAGRVLDSRAVAQPGAAAANSPDTRNKAA